MFIVGDINAGKGHFGCVVADFGMVRLPRHESLAITLCNLCGWIERIPGGTGFMSGNRDFGGYEVTWLAPSRPPAFPAPQALAAPPCPAQSAPRAPDTEALFLENMCE